MRRSANMTLIGAFVAAGIALVVVAVILLGAGSFGGSRPEAIAFFEDSVSGLDIGAPVKFRGVTIGKVSQVLLRTSGQPSSDYAVPVVMEFTPDLLTRRGLDQALLQKEGLGRSIAQGLRAKLQQQSVVTGVLYVELDYLPDTAFRLHDPDGPLAEIPTQPSNLGALTKAVSQTLDQLSRIDFVAITKKVDSILGRIDEGASKIEFGKINDNLTQAAANISKLTADPALSRAVTDFSAAMRGIDELVRRLSGKVDPVAEDLKSMAAAGRAALERLNETSENLRALTQPDSPARRDLDQALADVSEAAQAIRSLADFLERNPETIIQGRAKNPVKLPAADPAEKPAR
ncbi:MAG: MlaD family protein [Verrucomicrobiota bacterium]